MGEVRECRPVAGSGDGGAGGGVGGAGEAGPARPPPPRPRQGEPKGRPRQPRRAPCPGPPETRRSVLHCLFSLTALLVGADASGKASTPMDRQLRDIQEDLPPSIPPYLPRVRFTIESCDGKQRHFAICEGIWRWWHSRGLPPSLRSYGTLVPLHISSRFRQGRIG